MSTPIVGSGIAVKPNQNQAFSTNAPLKGNYDTTGLSSIGRSAVAVFLEYVQKMHPDLPQLEAQAIQYQVGLYRAISNTINRNTEDFNKTWGLMLAIFFDNKDGAFNERALYRYMANITLSTDQQVAFRRITVFMRQTAEVKSRAHVLSLMNLNHVFEKDVTPQGRQKLLSFYRSFMKS